MAVGTLASQNVVAQPNPAEPSVQAVNIGNGITLHYVDAGKGTPVISVHGALSDGGYWGDQVSKFAKHYRAIAYSRRYNYPNSNPARPGYSAVIDAEYLAKFSDALHLGRVAVIGHSYGALTALFLAAKHPELVQALVLAEPPAISLLAHLPGTGYLQKRCQGISCPCWRAVKHIFKICRLRGMKRWRTGICTVTCPAGLVHPLSNCCNFR